MPAPKTLAGYGDIYFNLLKAINQLNDARPEFTLDVGETGKATHMRQKFYAFRKVLQHEAPMMLSPNVQQVQVVLVGATLLFRLGESIETPLDVQLERQGFDLSDNGGGPAVPAIQPPAFNIEGTLTGRIPAQAPNESNDPGASAADVQRKFEEQLESLGFKGASNE